MAKAKDERFHRYGRLMVLNRADNTKDGDATWFCRCDCGNFIIVEGSALRSGNTKSCGCLRKDKVRQARSLPKGESSFHRILGQLKRNAKKRNLEWSITDNEVRSLISKPCYYCGKKPSLHYEWSDCNGSFPYTGIDRIDNSKGYLSDNIVSCCSLCNHMKYILSENEFRDQIIKIYNYLNLQNENKKDEN